MNTRDIMQMALDLGGMTTVPSDSAVLVPEKNVARVPVAIDISETDLRRAETEGLSQKLWVKHGPSALQR